MKVLVLGLHPHLDRDRFSDGDEVAFRDVRAFFREGVLRCFTPNLSAIALAGCLRDHAHRVEYLDLALEFGIPFTAQHRRARDRRLLEYLTRHPCDAVFIPCVSCAEHLTLACAARAIRQALPAAVIGVGSYHANTTREALLDDVPQLDYVFLGDLEPFASELLHRLEKGDLAGLAVMENVIVRRGRGEREASAAISRRRAESRFDYSVCRRYIPSYDCLAALATKGCPYDCAFCQEKVVRRYYDVRSPARVIDEVLENYAIFESECGDRDVAYGFMDPLFGLDRRWVREFLAELDGRTERFRWGFQTRVGAFSSDELAELARRGCSLIYYGLESFSPEMLLRMQKTRQPDTYLRRFTEDLRACQRLGIRVEVNVLFGHPGETAETLDENRRGIAAAKEAVPDISLNLNLFRPLPGTESCTDAEDRWGAQVLVSDWWKREVLPGTTVLMRPSPDLEPDALIRFYAEMYGDDACYERRGLTGRMIRYFEDGEIPSLDLPAVGREIRARVLEGFRPVPRASTGGVASRAALSV